MKKIHSAILLASTLSILALSGCTARIDQRGKIPDPEYLDKIKIGTDTKEDVLRLIGSPSTSGTFDNNTWLYIHKTTETVSFLEPKVIDQEIITFRFDRTGIIREIRRGDGVGHAVDPVKRITPAAGEKETPLQQVFGNFGRYSKKGRKE